MKKGKLWFKAKHYGWGWYPSSWQGWLVTLVFTSLIIIISITYPENYQSIELTVLRLILLSVIVVCLIIICYLKGEKPRWRWGN